jgi:hypothetical protein
MSLPAIGDVVTVVFEFDGVSVAIPGRIVAAGVLPVADAGSYMLWWSLDGNDVAHYHVRDRFEDIYWMAGSGPEVECALLAAYALAGGRGKDALSGEI